MPFHQLHKESKTAQPISIIRKWLQWKIIGIWGILVWVILLPPPSFEDSRDEKVSTLSYRERNNFRINEERF